MARIKNIELPNEKQVWVGLTSIYGIGKSLGKSICEDAKVDAAKKVKDLTEEEVSAIRKNIVCGRLCRPRVRYAYGL